MANELSMWCRGKAQEQAILPSNELPLPRKVKILSPQGIGLQAGAVGFVGRKALYVVDAIGDRGRAFMRRIVADEVAAATRDRLPPILRILLESILFEIDL